MEESKNKKISLNLSTLIIIVVIMCIAIITCVILIFDLRNQNKEIAELKNIINDELGEKFLNIATTFDKTSDTSNNYSYNNNEVQNFSDSIIKEAITNYIDISNTYYCSKIDLFKKLNLTDDEKSKEFGKNIIEDEYCSTDIKFEDYKNAMLQFMTEDCFEDNFCDDIKSLNGIVYYSNLTNINSYKYEISAINKEEDDPNVFNVVLKEIYDSSDLDDGNNENEVSEYLFALTSLNSKALISDSDF